MPREIPKQTGGALDWWQDKLCFHLKHRREKYRGKRQMGLENFMKGGISNIPEISMLMISVWPQQTKPDRVCTALWETSVLQKITLLYSLS